MVKIRPAKTEDNQLNLSYGYNTNIKLGKVFSISRIAGETCPNSCQHLDTNGGKCYAQKIQRIYPTALKAWSKNTEIKDWQKYRSLLLAAQKKNAPIRWHVSGDWLMTTKSGAKVLDKKYLNAVIKALESLDKDKIPPIWLYTHVPNKDILKLEKYGVKVYASSDTEDQYKKFKSLGFSLFAFNSQQKKGSSDSKIESTYSGKTPVCWEQLGTKKSCSDCGYCIKGKGSIVFLQH